MFFIGSLHQNSNSVVISSLVVFLVLKRLTRLGCEGFDQGSGVLHREHFILSPIHANSQMLEATTPFEILLIGTRLQLPALE